jgi:hypothetical protein
MKAHILYIPAIEGMKVAAEVRNGVLETTFTTPSSVLAPVSEHAPTKAPDPTNNSRVAEMDASYWNVANKKVAQSPKLVCEMSDVGKQYGLDVCALLVTSAKKGKVGHLFLPDGICKGRVFRPKQKYLCSSAHDPSMPRFLKPADELTCSECLTRVRSFHESDGVWSPDESAHQSAHQLNFATGLGGIRRGGM